MFSGFSVVIKEITQNESFCHKAIATSLQFTTSVNFFLLCFTTFCCLFTCSIALSTFGATMVFITN